jgi:heme/copper-type cytochrome/quinol oxidase subunit 2
MKPSNEEEDFDFLTVQPFKESTLLEYVWATFPTVIVVSIFMPSMLLLYSLDEETHPLVTIKIIGNQ